MSEKEKKELRRVTRVALRLPTETILKDWKMQFREAYSTFTPSDRELVEWAIEKTPLLSKKEMAEIKNRFFDDVKELESLVLQLREAKASGNQQSINDLLARVSFKRTASNNVSSNS